MQLTKVGRRKPTVKEEKNARAGEREQATAWRDEGPATVHEPIEGWADERTMDRNNDIGCFGKSRRGGGC